MACWNRARAALAGGVCGVLAAGPGASALPPNFVVEQVAGDWLQAVGLTFDGTGRAFVWEKLGRVWIVDQSGQRLPQPLIDLTEEVGAWRDHGLLGFALDPDFLTNGHFYLLYVVDYHHARYFGTPEYDPQADEFFVDTIGRITRYTADASTGFTSVLPGSRAVLVGESLTTGFPVTHQSHGAGTLLFGEDGSLLASFGDGASYDNVDTGGPRPGSSNTALADGIIRASEDVGAFRAQMVNSLSGKIVRIDPATGDGLPSNPFFDAGSPRSAQSRVWALGFRNPFRMTLRPGTGHAHHHDHEFPGVLYVGDVGWNRWDELSTVTEGGQNFGWPLFEGLEVMPEYAAAPTLHLEAPNPLFGQPGCAAYLTFQSLLVQDTLAAPSWPNPCNAGQQIPATSPRFVHRRPRIDYGRFGPARTGVYDGASAAVSVLGTAGCPVAGASFRGSSSTGGAFYANADFPPAWRDLYFHADFERRWIRAFRMNANDDPTEVIVFRGDETAGAVVDLESSDAAAGLYFIAYDALGGASLQRARYVDNLPPTAVASGTPTFGPYPLTVQFSSAGSVDPEGEPLRYRWRFGDGRPDSTEANPVHTYRPLEDITAQGTVIARVFELSPPFPIGGGPISPAVIRDGDFPPVGSNDRGRQYDTSHNGDQGSVDFIGYRFASARQLQRLQFQEGIHFADGGWFDDVRVEVRTGTGPWTAASGVEFSPAYAGNNGVNFETYEISMDPVTATEVRLVGDPGGALSFISVGELRVLATPAVPPTGPQRFDATLTVTDSLNNTSTASVLVSPNNTPPRVRITSPVNGATYPHAQTTTVPLSVVVEDDEHGPGQIECVWEVILHHNQHTHPEPPVFACAGSALLTPHGVPGERFFFEFRFTATDAQGLRASQTVYMYPDNYCFGDTNGDREVNFLDLNAVLSEFGSTGQPSALPGDLNGDGAVNFLDLNLVLSNFGRSC